MLLLLFYCHINFRATMSIFTKKSVGTSQLLSWIPGSGMVGRHGSKSLSSRSWLITKHLQEVKISRSTSNDPLPAEGSASWRFHNFPLQCLQLKPIQTLEPIRDILHSYQSSALLDPIRTCFLFSFLYFSNMIRSTSQFLLQFSLWLLKHNPLPTYCLFSKYI